MKENKSETSSQQIKTDQNLKGINYFSILLKIILLTLFSLGGYFLGKNNRFINESGSKSINSINNNTPSLSTSQSQFSSPSNLLDYNLYQSMADNVQFKYPKSWFLNMRKSSDLTDRPNAEDFSFTCFQGNCSRDESEFNMSLGLSATGVGGGCPNFDPSKEVVFSKPIQILGKKVYLIYMGIKNTNMVSVIYVSEDPQGICPNVAFVKISGLPGLFSSTLGYMNPNIKRMFSDVGYIYPGEKAFVQFSLDSFMSDPQIRQAEEILQSLTLIK